MDTIVRTLPECWPPPELGSDTRPASPPPPPASQSGRARRWSSRAAVASLIAVALWIDRSPIAVIGLVFVLVVPFEKLFPRHPGQRVRRPLVGTDLAHALAAPALTVASLVVAITVGIFSLAWIPGLMLRPLVALIPGAVLPFVGIVLFDLAGYWVHRWSHEVPLFWRFHSVHHSTEHLDWVSGFRNHPFDGAIVAPPFVLLLAAGFDANFVGALAAVQIVTGLFLHANVRWRWQPLHRLVITPEFHHWHHANEPNAHNSNYSVFLPLWDTVFGTYFMPKHQRPHTYGISEPMPATLMGQLRHPLGSASRLDRVIWWVVRHPWRTVRRVARAARSTVRDIWQSTRRPVRNPG